jgi:hypothetical protein
MLSNLIAFNPIYVPVGIRFSDITYHNPPPELSMPADETRPSHGGDGKSTRMSFFKDGGGESEPVSAH